MLKTNIDTNSYVCPFKTMCPVWGSGVDIISLLWVGTDSHDK